MDSGIDVLSLTLFVGTSAFSLFCLHWRQQRQLETHQRNNLLSVGNVNPVQPTSFHASFDQQRFPPKSEIMVKRKKYFSRCVSISYSNTEPLMLVKGTGVYLIDENGIAYLDTRNNVAHCGHSHPVICHAIQSQVGILNSNTRYLHPIVTELAERLVQLLPTSLDVVFFCNSGSEANDLALRIARAHSGGSVNTIVVDGAYHGHTIATLEISPYKYEHKPIVEHRLVTHHSRSGYTIQVPGKHIWKVPCPNTYRGKHRSEDTAGEKYSAYVQEACDYFLNTGLSETKNCKKVRALVIEGGMSVAGVILPPAGFMQRCANIIHAAGGLLIVDEIQTGFGRLGSTTWAFQHHGDDCIPDIVTVGKPFGNGMPLAAVITTSSVAASFECCNVEYFNTFGGNPVSAAAGLAMLNVLRDEELQKNALEVGKYIKERLVELKNQVQVKEPTFTSTIYIGDIRGSGLFLGIEFVTNLETQEPATTETSAVCSLLKSKYKILSSIDGIFENVIVFKPPMVFSQINADYFVDSLKQILTNDLNLYDNLGKGFTPT